jgi:starch phosphorylase
MSSLQLYNVAPKIPDELLFLKQLSYSMWWSWQPSATDLFARIDPTLWRESGNNARKLLNIVPQARFEELAKNKEYLRHLRRVKVEFENKVLSSEKEGDKKIIAYFSMEYGIHESINLYSGGLGILSGDHLKAASDLKLPIVGVGLLYNQGYFTQFFDHTGWQRERYPENEINNMPLTQVMEKDGSELFIKVRLLDREIAASVWKLEVGNVELYLLDTELPQNPAEFREITSRLYGGDRKMRLEQELLLGIGGYRALVRLGYEPAVCHMNEGHAAFLSLARIPHIMEKYNLDSETALEIVWRTNVFTTHTPVPAGNEAFDIKLLTPYLDALRDDIKLDTERILNWGMPPDKEGVKEMSMTVLGFRMSNYCNGVSKLHGEVSREMWKHIWPQRALEEIPISHITNGVHIATWLARRKRILYDRFLDFGWLESLNKKHLKESIHNIPNEELWMAHEMCRHTLVKNSRDNIKKQIGNSDYSLYHLREVKLLDPNVLTIGFARRFATYKRGALLLRNPERFEALLTNKEHPVQFIFAGKAHPADDEGKKIIQQLIQFSRKPELWGKIVFLEGYDTSLARDLVQGADVWLNTPRRPMEASGTSGMKAAANGVLNCSILDGWWAEAYTPERGWAIPTNENYENSEDGDEFEANALFNLLENEIIPCFYDRPEGTFPVRWINKMKESIVMALDTFSTVRMVSEYNEKFYQPAKSKYNELTENEFEYAKKLVEQKKKLVDNFDKVHIEAPQVDGDLNNIHVGDTFTVNTKAYLAGLKPEDVDVQVYYGKVDSRNKVHNGNTVKMDMVEDLGDGNYLYSYKLKSESTGRFGLTCRITPQGNAWKNSKPGFVCWSD